MQDPRRLPLAGPTGQRGLVPRSINLRDWEDWQIITFDSTKLELTDGPASAAHLPKPDLEALLELDSVHGYRYYGAFGFGTPKHGCAIW